MVTLLRSLGCTATSHEYAGAFGGDDIAVRREGDAIDPTLPREAMQFVRNVARTAPPSQRLRVRLAGMTRGARVAAEGARADCEVARHLATKLQLGDGVAAALYQGFERFDGRGHPDGLRGDAILLSARIAAAASVATMFDDALGSDDAVSILRRWSSRALDPQVVDALLAVWPDVRAAQGDPVVTLLDVEPAPQIVVAEERLDAVAAAFASVADLKATHLHGHSTGVAALAADAARIRGADDAAITTLRRAALLHDLGRAAVPAGTWERSRSLSTAEWERVRLHPYHTERILARSAVLAPLGRIAGMHHERVDGSGYHRGCGPSEQDRLSRTLAAADAFHALVEPRPHRPALSADDAARTLRGMALDVEATETVLQAAGQARQRTRTWPAGLTQREVEVLRLVVRGMSMRQVASELFISASTVHTHLAHVYEKAGVSTRAAAAVFAMDNGLLEP
jgi:HD-GYP domain-containing protein (c-di-GMP phosphodiesterase class II)